MRKDTYLHPEEQSSWFGLDLKQVHSVVTLLDFFEFGDIGEQNERLLHCLAFVKVSESNHAWLQGVSCDSDPATTSVRSDHTAIEVHATGLKLTERRGSLTEAWLATTIIHLLKKSLKLTIVHF